MSDTQLEAWARLARAAQEADDMPAIRAAMKALNDFCTPERILGLIDAAQPQQDVRGMLEKATVRLGILRDRMASCDESMARVAPAERGHELSRFEIAGWIEEQEAACRLDECSEDCEVDETTGECRHAGPAAAPEERDDATQ